MQVRTDRHDDLPELGGPARRFVGSRHEARVVVDRLEQRGFKPVPDIEHAEAAVAEAARPIGTRHA